MSLVVVIEIIIVLIISIVICIIMEFMYKYFHAKKIWTEIEQLNDKSIINRKSAYIDKLGYLRWKKNDRLCHRDIAYNQIYKLNPEFFKTRFSDFVIHHKNRNKLDCRPENLELLSNEEHQMKHGKIIFLKHKKYIRLAKKNKINKKTKKAIYVFNKWIPKSQIIVINNWIYVTNWMYEKKF
ncbi:MAG: HNH endonuclease [Candidatus Helarchaeota archaeon]